MAMENMSLDELAKAQEKHRQQMAVNREKVRQQKVRTHRLVVIGATLEKYWPELTDMNDNEIRMTISDVCKNQS